jgi:hypothetical protein
MKNHIIELAQANGYKNEGTNRERTIKNLNLLLDSGILTIKLSHADRYNDLEKSYSFWFVDNDGKKRCTNYTFKLYNKSFYGHFVPKKSSSVIWGEKVLSNIDNSKLDLHSMMISIARTLSKMKGNGDFMESSVFAKYGECSCQKCNGRGIIPGFMHYAEGVCFDCGGSGIRPSVLKSYIEESINLTK